MVFHLILISAQVQSKAGVPVLEGVTFGVFSRIQSGAASADSRRHRHLHNYVGLRDAQAENEQLKQQVADLEVRLQEQRALAARARPSWNRCSSCATVTQLPTLAAEVIAGNPEPGPADRHGQPRQCRRRPGGHGCHQSRKASSGGSSARSRRTPRGCSCSSTRPPRSRSLAERTRTGGLVVGAEGDPPLRMEMVSNAADVVAGDVVVASGVDGIYPKGFVVGTIETSERGGADLQAIIVKPAVDFSSLEEVLIVLVPARGAMPEEPPASRGQEVRVAGGSSRSPRRWRCRRRWQG